MAPPATVSYIYGYKVATRPRSAPFGRAAPGANCHPPLWRSLPGRKPTGQQGGSPRLRPLSSRARAASQDSVSTDADAPAEGVQRSAREWHVSDHQIERLVEQLQQDAINAPLTGATSSPRPWARRASVSPCQVNRPLLCCGRLKKPKELEVETSSIRPSTVDPEAELWAARAAKDDHEVAEMERIKYFFRKPKESEVKTPQEMARCQSAPSRGHRKESTGPGRPQQDVKSNEVLVTLNFMDTGDKYTIHVDPDLTIGASSKTSGLKGIIEEITGVSASDQILFCKRCKMGNDRHTLRSYHAHDNAEVLVRFKQQRSKFPQACTVKWRQQQQIRSQRRDRAREYSTSRGGKHRVQQCWQSCVAPQNGTYFQYAKRGIEGKLAARFDLHSNGQPADIRTNLFHDPFLSFGDYHTYRPDEHLQEWERIRTGNAYNTKLEFEQ